MHAMYMYVYDLIVDMPRGKIERNQLAPLYRTEYAVQKIGRRKLAGLYTDLLDLITFIGLWFR